jgi:hypothetical protein
MVLVVLGVVLVLRYLVGLRRGSRPAEQPVAPSDGAPKGA